MAIEPSRDMSEQRLRAFEQEIECLRSTISTLENRERSYRTLMDNLEEGIFEILPGGRFGLFNKTARRITGYSGNELEGISLLNLMPSAISTRWCDRIQEVFQTGKAVILKECPLYTKHGDIKNVEVLTHPVFDRTGNVASIYVVIKHNDSREDNDGYLEAAFDDINRELEEVMERLNRMALEGELTSIELNQIFNTSGDGMWVVDKQFTITRVNDTFLQLLGRSSDETIGAKCYEVFSGTACRTSACPLERLKKGKKRVECDTGRLDEHGVVKPFILTASPFRDFGDEFIGIVEAFKDITERKRIEEALHSANSELERLATIDGLTLVANRRCFNERFRQEWSRLVREGLPLSLIMSDVDCFKLYNDQYGHLLGDDCLRAVAGAIKSHATRPADLVARYGGEEFVVLLPNTPGKGAASVAEQMRREVEKLQIPHKTSPVNDYVTLSLGIATVVPGTGFDPMDLIKAADNALYEAKEQGRNRWVVSSWSQR